MEDSKRFFIYCNAKGDISKRVLLSITEGEYYLQGICTESRSFRTFRKDRILAEVDNIDLLENKFSYFSLQDFTPQNTALIEKGAEFYDAVRKLLDICFTGFSRAEKAALEMKAKSAGMSVKKSVTQSLGMLCCGENAGPSKVAKARAQGAIILTVDQFHTLLETGEIPEA